MTLYDHLNFLQLDSLREAGNIGAGNAATSLSKLLDKKIVMKVPEARLASLTEVTEIVGGAENLVTAVFLRIEGDVPGSMFLIFSVEEADALISHLTGNSELSLDDEIGVSAIQETGNIMAGSYLSALSDFTGLTLLPTPPFLTVDMAGAILESGLPEKSRYEEHAIMIETSFSEWDEIKSHFLLLPDPDSFLRLFQALGVPLDE
ncbi:MAG TPA: chemotaxis protein CheC [Bacillales bacterium]|nr:chemotaxis protein CheC [Bacillales bacterium]